MKTFLTITHRLRRFTALLVTFTLLHGGLSAFAATVSWTGAGGDGFWSNPLNWNGNVLPVAEDDVVINVPGNATVRLDTGGTWVRSLQCQESFILETGPLTVTEGASFINGIFSMGVSQILTVDGATATFTVNGAATRPC